MRKYKIDPNLLIAAGVLLSSFSALFVYIQQASIMREQTELLLEQTKANAWPYLTLAMSQNHSKQGLESYILYLSNKGTGPVIIEGAIITYQEKSIQKWNDLYDLIDVPDTINRGYTNSILYEQIIQPGEEFMLVNWNDRKELMRYIYDRSEDITIEVCYRSVYNDRWHVKRTGFRTNLEKNIREEVEVCNFIENALFLE